MRFNLARTVSAAFLLATMSVMAGCASAGDGGGEPGSDDSFATAGDKEIARIGGGGSYALAEDGAYFVFDRALYRVDDAGTKTRLADAPDHAEDIVITERYVVLESSSTNGSESSLTFYDRNDKFAAKVIAAGARAIQLLPAGEDRVLVSFMEKGVVLVSATGEKKTVLTPEPYQELRDMQKGKNSEIVYGTMRKDAGVQLIELNIKTGKTRAILTVDKGSFFYAYDAETDTFFTERNHRDFPQQSIVAIYDAKGTVLKTLETPLNVGGAPIAAHDGFYLAARLGMSPGGGSWKLLTFDKTTLTMTDRGRVEPQVYRMVLRGPELFYSHSKDSATPLRVRRL